jgi:GNAT superfamily N-acetyltransferase
MSIQITPVSLADTAAFDAYFAGQLVMHKREVPNFPEPQRVLTERAFEFPWPGMNFEDYVVTLGGEPAGYVHLGLPMEDNTTRGHFDVVILPAFRGRGFGHELLAFAEERAKANGRVSVNTHTVWNLPELNLTASDQAGIEFARRQPDYREALPEVNRVLHVNDVDESVLDKMLEHAKDKADGYRVVRWIDAAPEELVHDVAYLDGRLLQDAPMGDTGWEAADVTSARVRRDEKCSKDRGRTNFHTGMVHEESGKLVAWTTISSQDVEPDHGWQQITIVDPEHRGHRLGAYVKVENYRFFTENCPEVAVIDTFNAHENSYMISINEEMGFRPQYAFQNWRRDFPSATAE